MKEQSKKLPRSKKAKDISKEVDKEKLKVSILIPEMLHIGKWKFEPTLEGDELVVKFFFIMKQLAMEVSRNGYRQKIEIEWSNIVGMKATLKENGSGTLKIELLLPPKFYQELKIDRRSHNKWIDGSDFTEDQASRCRRYLINFPPGVLKESFERLINCDKRLYGLSQSRFPTFELAYFPSQFFVNRTQMIPMIGSSNNLQMASSSSSSSMPQYSQVPNDHLSNFNMVSNDHLLNNRLTCPNEVSNGHMLSGPTYPIGASNNYCDPTNDHLLDGSTYFNGVSNNYSNLPTDPRGVWLPPPQESEKED